MDLHEESIEGVTVYAVKGRVDSYSAPAFRERLEALAAAPRRALVVDLADLEYVSSAGLNALLAAAKHAEAVGTRFVFCGLSPQVRRVFGVAGFLELFAVAPSRAEALAEAMRQGG